MENRSVIVATLFLMIISAFGLIPTIMNAYMFVDIQKVKTKTEAHSRLWWQFGCFLWALAGLVMAATAYSIISKHHDELMNGFTFRFI